MLLLFVLGLLVRIVGLPMPGMVDVKAWKAWGAMAAALGVAKVYGPSDAEVLQMARERGGLAALSTMEFPRTFFPYHGEEFYVDYPPASMLLLWMAGKLYAAWDPGELHGRLYNVLLNLLPLTGSLSIAWILLRTDPGALGERRALAFWCNPALLLAALLGYQDPVFAAFALPAVLALMRGAHVRAAVLVAAAGLLKPQGSLLLPTLLVVLFAESGPRTWLRAALAGAALVVLVLTPWWWQGHLLSALNGGLRPLGEDLLSAQGLNVWWIAGWLVERGSEGAATLARILSMDDFTTLAGWDPRVPSRVLLALATLGNVAILLRTPREDRLRIPLSVILQTHVYALVGTSVHENHAYLTLVLAPLLLGVWDKVRAYLAAASGFLLLNLFLFEGLGRGIIRDRPLYKLRKLIGLDLTLLVAAAHVALVAALFAWLTQRARASAGVPAREARGTGD